MAIWDDVIPAEDLEVYAAAGFGKPYGYGERPVVLVVDAMYSFAGDADEPILDSIAKWRTSCGSYAWESIPYIVDLIGTAREQEIPIFYTTMEYRADGFDRALHRSPDSAAATDVAGSLGNEVVAEIAPREEDIVIVKPKPSAYFATPLIGHLTYLQADTVIIVGSTTSGCVRAAAIDTSQYNLRAIVPEECVWDRGIVSHKVNLFEIEQKYGDVKPTSDVIDYLRTLPKRPFGDRSPGPLPSAVS